MQVQLASGRRDVMFRPEHLGGTHSSRKVHAMILVYLQGV